MTQHYMLSCTLNDELGAGLGVVAEDDRVLADVISARLLNRQRVRLSTRAAPLRSVPARLHA